MSNLNLNLPHHSNSKRFSREGFQPIPTEHDGTMATNDATIDIPLEPVQSIGGGGLRSQSSTTGLQAERTNTSSEKKRSLWKPRGRRPKPEDRIKPKGKVGYDGEEDTINVMGKVYKKIRDFSTVTRYFLYVLPLAAIIAIPIIIDAVSPTHDKVGGVRLLWFFVRIPIGERVTQNIVAPRGVLHCLS
jgi:hypothetical protein